MSDQSRCLGNRWRMLGKPLIILVPVILGFGSGYISGFWMSNYRLGAEASLETRRQFYGLLAEVSDMGIIAVDRDRLNEIICIVSEAEWEDRDAEDRVAEKPAPEIVVP